MLARFFALLAGRRLPRVEHVGLFTMSGSGANWSFTGLPIGAASHDRLVCFAIHASAGGSRTLSSATVDGSATGVTIDSTTNVGSTVPTLYVYKAIPAGETCDLALTFSNTMSAALVAVFNITGLNSFSPVQAGTTSTPGTGLNMTAGQDGVLVAHRTSGAAATWGGATEVYDNGTSSGAIKNGTGTLEPVATDAVSGRLAAITWR